MSSPSWLKAYPVANNSLKTVIRFATTGGSKHIMVAELLLQRAQTAQDMPEVIALHACITRNPQLGVAACLSAQPCRHR